jgi:hypothetical protein
VRRDLDDLTRCFSRKVGAWFEEGGRRQVSDPVYLRQMNMAVALAASKWNEFATGDDPIARMRDWLEEVRRRAVVRDATARAEAIEQARQWFEACVDQAA